MSQSCGRVVWWAAGLVVATLATSVGALAEGPPLSAEQAEKVRQRLDMSCPAHVDMHVFMEKEGTLAPDTNHNLNFRSRYCSGLDETLAIKNMELCTRYPEISGGDCHMNWPKVSEAELAAHCTASTRTFQRTKVAKFLGVVETMKKSTTVSFTTYTCDRADVIPSCIVQNDKQEINIYKKLDLTDLEKFVSIGIVSCVVDQAKESTRRGDIADKRILLTGLLQARGGILANQCGADQECRKRVERNWKRAKWRAHGLFGTYGYDSDTAKVMKLINAEYTFERMNSENGYYAGAAQKSHELLEGFLALRKAAHIKKHCPTEKGPCAEAISTLWINAESAAHGLIAHYPNFGKTKEVMAIINAGYDNAIPIAAKEGMAKQKTDTLGAMLTLKKGIWLKKCPPETIPKSADCIKVVEYLWEGLGKEARNKYGKAPYFDDVSDLMRDMSKKYDALVDKAIAPFKS